MRSIVILALLTFSFQLRAENVPSHPTVANVTKPPPAVGTLPIGVVGVAVAARNAAAMGLKAVDVTKAIRVLSGLDLSMGVTFAVADKSVKDKFDSVNNNISLWCKGKVAKMSDDELASTYGQFMQNDIQQLAAAARNNKTMAIGALAKVAIEKAKIILTEAKDPSQINPDFMVSVSWLFFIGKTISEHGGGNVLAQTVIQDVELSPDRISRKPTSIVQ